MASCVLLCVPMATYLRHPLALLTLPRSLSHLLPRSGVWCHTTTRSLANTLYNCWQRANRKRQVRTLPLPQMPSAPPRHRHRHRQPSPRRILSASLNLPTTPPSLPPLSNAVGMQEMQSMCWNSVGQANYQAIGRPVVVSISTFTF